MVYTALDHTSFLLMLARLRLDDWRNGSTETQTDQVLQEGGEHFREAFPEVDLDDPRVR